ncbi:MAG: hypothetical protein KDE53_19595, partial [Caldilineaceae bacterium]|nr:hypothetical protein [Caldilineaceae bacterium]
IFLQEYFAVYPDHGVFDWSRLDPYMDALAATGAKVLATINFKPPVLFPTVDQAIWRPNNVAEWQQVIGELVKRYSVDKPIVTHWEHVNEPDIGEQGGCPYLITTAEENFECYQMLLKPILAAFPEAKVGGPAIANPNSPIVPGFIDLCRRTGTQLDFISWHRYSSDMASYPETTAQWQAYLTDWPDPKPAIMLNEWNQHFPFYDPAAPSYHLLSVEEMARSSRRAAFIAANLLSLMKTNLAWSHYFLLWDSCCYPEQFAGFYSPESIRGVMYKHWNETGHRFGLFSEGGAVRPQYFVYQMLSRMGDEQIATTCDATDLHVQAVGATGKLSLLIANYDREQSRDCIVTTRFTDLQPGIRRLRAWRIDDQQRWSDATLELLPLEERTVSVLPEFQYQFYAPADSVLFVTLEEIP